MDIFLCWSGDRSQKVAEALKSWLKLVIQASNPWMSTEIGKGLKWSPQISEKLEKCKIGIICINQENLNHNWILFEAGALAKLKDSHVCTFLLDIKPGDIEEPLAQFQATRYKKDDIFKLVDTINQTLQKESLSNSVLKESFEAYWPKLDEKLRKIKDIKPHDHIQERKIDDILLEVLENTREIKRNLLTPTDYEQFYPASSFQYNFTPWALTTNLDSGKLVQVGKVIPYGTGTVYAGKEEGEKPDE